MTCESAKNFRGVGIGPLSKILAVKVDIFMVNTFPKQLVFTHKIMLKKFQAFFYRIWLHCGLDYICYATAEEDHFNNKE